MAASCKFAKDTGNDVGNKHDIKKPITNDSVSLLICTFMNISNM